MAEKWHRATKCLDCYYCRYLSNGTTKIKPRDSSDWDGKICYYTLDTELPRRGRGETCECHITIEEYLNKPNSELKRKISKMLKSKKSIKNIKRETGIPEKYIRDIAKELNVNVEETSLLDELLEYSEED